jgi:hypothetical protein
MGMPPPRLVRLRPTVEELLNRPMNERLDIIIRPSFDTWLENLMIAVGTFLLTLWRNLSQLSWDEPELTMRPYGKYGNLIQPASISHKRNTVKVSQPTR